MLSNPAALGKGRRVPWLESLQLLRGAQHSTPLWIDHHRPQVALQSNPIYSLWFGGIGPEIPNDDVHRNFRSRHLCMLDWWTGSEICQAQHGEAHHEQSVISIPLELEGKHCNNTSLKFKATFCYFFGRPTYNRIIASGRPDCQWHTSIRRASARDLITVFAVAAGNALQAVRREGPGWARLAA
jgi:hypothetical protein